MNQIIEQANNLANKYNTDDLYFILDKLKIRLFELPLGKIIKEAYFKDLKALVIDSGLHPYQKRHLTAHAIGHYILHKNRKANYFLDDKDNLMNKLKIWYKEREAEMFAAYFLIPKDKLGSLLEEDWLMESGSPIPELAEEFQVPEELMRKRLEFKDALNC